mmetsp:Transcript_511/g.1164  ORF Transcript_511/g.1164 Transcript_511/m.1164 type:complete len:794 (-) Transcript_511:92-2473(-)
MTMVSQAEQLTRSWMPWAAAAMLALAGAATECEPCHPGNPPGPGALALSLNGVIWPTYCVGPTPPNETEHFFTIGDWGGIGKYAMTFDNTAEKREYVGGIDNDAQWKVADIMKVVAAKTHPKFIINVGDNFYPGGVETPCMVSDMCTLTDTTRTRTQWDRIWNRMYKSEDLQLLEWWGVLGNHDWGGFSFGNGWPETLKFTWHSDRWLTPALYWERRVQYCDWNIDFFFVDTNIYDVHHPSFDPKHNICSWENNRRNCEDIGGPSDCWDCVGWFHDMYANQTLWLERRLNQSDADWQIVVTHYPPQYGRDLWRRLVRDYGVDMLITGHRHQQEVHYHDRGTGWTNLDLGDTVWTVTGGGGGVTSESNPLHENAWVQQYGFMDIAINKESATIDMWSGVTNKMRRQVTVTPRARPSPPDMSAPLNSCARLTCNGEFVKGNDCQCTSSCAHYKNCCDDYVDLCSAPAQRRLRRLLAEERRLSAEASQGSIASCAGAANPAAIPCGSRFNRSRPCQCNSACYQYGNCCDDFWTQCSAIAPATPRPLETGQERCSSIRRRGTSGGMPPHMQEDGPFADLAPSGDGLLPDPDMAVYNGWAADLSGENCFEHCGNRSGYCDYFCGQGKACCKKNVSAEDAEVCQTIGVFSGHGYECVTVDEAFLIYGMQGGSLNDELVAQAVAENEGRAGTWSSVPWWTGLVIAIAMVPIIAGAILISSVQERVFRKKKTIRRSSSTPATAVEQTSPAMPPSVPQQWSGSWTPAQQEAGGQLFYPRPVISGPGPSYIPMQARVPGDMRG